MRGGDHDAGVGAERLDRKGRERRRVLRGEYEGLAARGGDDLGGVLLELCGAVASVAADDDLRCVDLVLEPRHEAVGRADDDGAVHVGLARAHGGAQAGGAEGEGTGEGGLESLSVFGSDPRVDLVAGFRVRVVLGPGAGGGEKLFGDGHFMPPVRPVLRIL